MIKAKYDGGLYDDIFLRLFKDLSKNMKELNDDMMFLCVGATGTGKSSLMLHGMEIYLGKDKAKEVGVQLIGFNRESFADCIHHASKMKHPRTTLNDEANVSKRESLTKYNRDLLDLYFSVRGLNILHLWCNPSLEMIDKSFVKEKIRGIFFIPAKSKTIRKYYYFRRTDILRILKLYKTLDLDILRRVKGTSFYCGWFRAYNGVMWKDYMEKKENRMTEKVNIFYEKYGSKFKTFTSGDLAKILNCGKMTIKRYTEKLLEKDVHYTVNGLGTRRYKMEAIDLLKETIEKVKRKK